jgi:hypothetical protein
VTAEAAADTETGELIADDGSPLKYFTLIPHILDDSSLSVYAVRLYLHAKRVAGERTDGACWQSTRTLAEQCKMSLGAVTNAKKELLEKRWIRIEKVASARGERDVIRIADVWLVNMQKYGKRSYSERSPSVHEMNTSVHTVNTSVHTVNNKKNIREEEHKEEDVSHKTKKVRKKKQRVDKADTLIPEDMRVLTEKMKEQGRRAALGGINLDDEHAHFVARADRDEVRHVSWSGAWATWLAQAIKFAKERGTWREPKKTEQSLRSRLQQEGKL